MKLSVFLFVCGLGVSVANAQESSTQVPTIEIIGGPTSGVVYLEAPSDYAGNWRTSQYQRGSLGNQFEVNFKTSDLYFDVSLTAFNQNPADQNNHPNSDGTTSQQTRWSFRAGSQDIRWGSFGNGFEYGANFKTMYEIRANKYVQDVDHRGIDVSKPIRDDYSNTSFNFYLKKEWKPKLNWSDRLDLAVRASIEASPISLSGVFRDRDIENFQPQNSATSGAMVVRGQFAVMTLLKIKNSQGQEKWVVALSALQSHDAGIGNDLSYDQLTFRLQGDYQLSKKMSVGLRLQENKESASSAGIGTKYYEVENVAALVAKFKIGR